MPRERIEPHAGDSRYARRDEQGPSEEVEDVGRSLTQDRRREASTGSKKGEGDRGDRRE